MARRWRPWDRLGARAAPSTMTVRAGRFAAPSDAPRWWWGDNAFRTHLANALNLIFPEGERFFIRSVRQALPGVDDPALLARVRAFMAQEAQHGRAHEGAIADLAAQGFPVEEIVARYRWWAFEVIEPAASPALRLAVTAALEHLTATLAEHALQESFLDDATPEMVALLRWHAAEELEHKSVAFDVFEAVDGRYAMRVAGMIVALSVLMAMWGMTYRALVRADGALTAARLAEDRVATLRRGQNRRHLWRGFFEWMHPGFHPDRVDNLDLARAWLARHRPDSAEVDLGAA
jgi:predicted metal-dependent hydrolase